MYSISFDKNFIKNLFATIIYLIFNFLNICLLEWNTLKIYLFFFLIFNCLLGYWFTMLW